MANIVDKPAPKKRERKDSKEGGRRLIFVLLDEDVVIDSDSEFFPMFKKAHGKPNLSVSHEWIQTGTR